MARRLKKAVSRGAAAASRSGSHQKAMSRRDKTPLKTAKAAPRKAVKKAAPARKPDKRETAKSAAARKSAGAAAAAAPAAKPATAGRAGAPKTPSAKIAPRPDANRKAAAGAKGTASSTGAGVKKAAVASALLPARTIPSPVRMNIPLLRPPTPTPTKPSAADEERLKKARELKLAEEKQAEQYGKAVKFFNARRFDQALALFSEVSEGPHPALRDRARVHTKICHQQQQTYKVQLKTAEEFYNYGIKLMNERSLDEADRHLKQALKLEPKAAHIHFARAILGALRGDRERSYESLKRAVELDPRNRYLARNDADLAAVLNDPSIAALLHEEGNST